MTMTNWDDFRFLLSLEQTGSLSAAARRLGVSQPTVTRRIAELERSLGVALVERLPDGYRLSAAGEKVCHRARTIEQKAEEIRHAVVDERDELQQVVVVAAPEGVAAALVTPGLRELRARHPHLVVEVAISTLPADLRRREADIAVRMGDPRDDTLIGRKVGVVQIGLFAPKELVDALGPPETPNDLVRYPYIESTGEISHLPQANWLRLAIPPRMKAYGANSISNQIEAFNAGLGLLALPTYLSDRVPGAVRVLPQTFARQIDMRVMHHAPAATKPGVRAILDFLGAYISDRLKPISGPGAKG